GGDEQVVGGGGGLVRAGRGAGAERGDLGGDAVPGRLRVGLVGVVAEVVAAGAHGGDSRGAGAHERVQDHVALVRVEDDQALRQLDREGRRVVDPGGALGGQLPHVEGGVEELVGRGGGLVGQAAASPLGPVHGTVEPALAGDHDPLGEVPQHR